MIEEFIVKLNKEGGKNTTKTDIKSLTKKNTF